MRALTPRIASQVSVLPDWHKGLQGVPSNLVAIELEERSAYW